MNLATKRKGGFTIPELGFVVTLILILSLVSVFAYRGVQARSRDSVRKTDIAYLVKGTQQYKIAKGDYAEAGCGVTTAGTLGTGWLATDFDGAGVAKSINDCLLTGGFIDKVVTDPSGQVTCGGASCSAYIKISCQSPSPYVGTWYGVRLETGPSPVGVTDATCQTSYDTSYGINHLVKVD